MSGAVFSYGNACMGGADLDVQVRVAHGVSHLLKGTACREHGKGACKRYFSGSSKTFTDAEKERLATEKNDRYRKLLAQMSPADMPTAVRDALTALHNAGLKLAVGSSSKNAAYILERLDANRYFDAVCDGTMIAHSKPDPEVFTKAAAMVGLAPADCLVVEDAAAGLEAARAGGMDCAIVGTAPMPFEPTYHMQDVTKLPGTIL